MKHLILGLASLFISFSSYAECTEADKKDWFEGDIKIVSIAPATCHCTMAVGDAKSFPYSGKVQNQVAPDRCRVNFVILNRGQFKGSLEQSLLLPQEFCRLSVGGTAKVKMARDCREKTPPMDCQWLSNPDVCIRQEARTSSPYMIKLVK